MIIVEENQTYKHYYYILRNGKRIGACNLKEFIHLVMYFIHNKKIEILDKESHCALMDIGLEDTQPMYKVA